MMKGSSNKLETNSGQTLVEILLAIGVAVLVLIGLTRATTVGLRNAQFAKNKALATKYGQETLEAIRAYRDQNDWTTFKTSSDCSPAFSVLPAPFDNPRSVSCDCYIDINPADCSDVNVDKVEVTVVISWDSGEHQVELATFLTKWEK